MESEGGLLLIIDELKRQMVNGMMHSLYPPRLAHAKHCKQLSTFEGHKFPTCVHRPRYSTDSILIESLTSQLVHTVEA